MKTQKLCFSTFAALSAVHIMRYASTNDLHVLHGIPRDPDAGFHGGDACQL
ncbi:hypothetical protein PR001_g32358 [Phytophthora rubi]|uniref:Uncharacterized protein n=1 Tax=Phytophthora rubi TaxID=129364 RepID=A0A6A3GBR9_9STRA|nr:hypothetical protein PR001_g32358 [Phytophthora rubi]